MNIRFLSLGLLLLAAGCSSGPPRIAAPAPEKPPVVLAPPPPPADWRDAAETPGGWRYARDAAGSVARFGAAGVPALFELRCVAASRLVTLARPASIAVPMTVTTSYGPMTWPGTIVAGRLVVSLRAADPALDRIAFSRGRFSVAGPALPTLILPAWAEPARVIEDCRA